MCKSTECSNIIIVVKTTIRKKVAEKLDNPLITPKAYWPILKNFFADKQNSKYSTVDSK